jgi:hypothetical protein
MTGYVGRRTKEYTIGQQKAGHGPMARRAQQAGSHQMHHHKIGKITQEMARKLAEHRDKYSKGV